MADPVTETAKKILALRTDFMKALEEATRQAYMAAFEAAGYPIGGRDKALLKRSVYLDRKESWSHPPAVLINYEEGLIPSPHYLEQGEDMTAAVNDWLRAHFSRKVYIEYLNGALSYVVVEDPMFASRMDSIY